MDSSYYVLLQGGTIRATGGSPGTSTRRAAAASIEALHFPSICQLWSTVLQNRIQRIIEKVKNVQHRQYHSGLSY